MALITTQPRDRHGGRSCQTAALSLHSPVPIDTLKTLLTRRTWCRHLSHKATMLTRRLGLRIAVGSAARLTRASGLSAFQRAARLPSATSSRYLPKAFGIRRYATPGKPKKGSVGESSPRARKPASATVKKAAPTKTAAKKPATKSVAKPTNKESLAKTREQARKVKEQARKAKEQARKAKLKAQADVKKKRAQELAAAKKQRAAAKTARASSPEGKARAKSAKDKAGLQKLKELALSPPSSKAATAWLVLSNERARSELTGQHGAVGLKLAEAAKSSANAYRNLSPAEMEVSKIVKLGAISTNACTRNTITLPMSRRQPGRQHTKLSSKLARRDRFSSRTRHAVHYEKRSRPAHGPTSRMIGKSRNLPHLSSSSPSRDKSLAILSRSQSHRDRA